MPLTTTIPETQKIQAGNAHAISRFYPNGCPHGVGAMIMLAYERPNGEVQVYARARVKAVDEMSLKNRSGGKLADQLAVREGFTNAAAWSTHFRQLYKGGLKPDTVVHRLQVAVSMVGAGDDVSASSEATPEVEGPRPGESRSVGSIDPDDVADLIGG